PRSAACSRASAVTAAGLEASTATLVAICAVPGFPGATINSLVAGSVARLRARACSRAPEPIRRIFTNTEPTGTCALPDVLLAQHTPAPSCMLGHFGPFRDTCARIATIEP